MTWWQERLPILCLDRDGAHTEIWSYFGYKANKKSRIGFLVREGEGLIHELCTGIHVFMYKGYNE